MDLTDLSPLVQALLKPEAYPERPEHIELAQTHISYLFFTPEHVYKVKKPVDFGFLDFTTLEKRRYYCQQELALNRRLSPDVYLEVVSICQKGDRCSIGGPGEVVEYAVKMRRLPADRMLTQLLAQNQVSEEMMKELARLLADFHQKAATSPTIRQYGSPQAIRQNAQENFDQTIPYIGQTISPKKHEELKKYTYTFLEKNVPLFEQRMREDRIRDCHGDLHSAQICFAPEGVRIFDCIEFNERFRYCDVASDIAFLLMDLDFHGRSDLGWTLSDSYFSASGDSLLAELLGFYKSYRAYVRGKVESFRLDDPHLPLEDKESAVARARKYFDLAYSYIHVGRRRNLVITCGLIGTGKSSLAEGLASEAGMVVISSDLVRKRLAGLPPVERQYEAFGKGIYSSEYSQKTYGEMLRMAHRYLDEGQSVILDATFRQAKDRQQVKALAQKMGAEFWVMECVCDENVIQQRLEKRVREGASPSDGRWEIFQQEKAAFEKISQVPQGRYIVVDTSYRPVDETVKEALEKICSKESSGRR